MHTMWRVAKAASSRSNLAMVPKLLSRISNPCETQMGNFQVSRLSLGLRKFSSINGNINGETSANDDTSDTIDFKNDEEVRKFLLEIVEGMSNPSNPPPEPIPEEEDDTPTLATYNALIDKMCDDKGVDYTLKTISLLKSKGLFPDEEWDSVNERLNKRKETEEKEREQKEREEKEIEG